MQREEITRALAGYEGDQPVGEVRFGGERVWPVVRTRAAMRLLGAGRLRAAAPRPAFGARVVGALRRRSQRLRGAPGPEPRIARADLVFLTSTNRSQKLGRTHVHTVVGPWAEALRRSGRAVAVWATGERRPLGAGEVHVEPAWRHASRLALAAVAGPPPPWFEAFRGHLRRELGADLAWEELFRELAAVDAAADLFGRWLRRSGTRGLVVDCWYGREALGAATAAHRLGIPVIDLQHGLQGRGHLAYDGWSAPPGGGYASFPDRFWVWGARDAEALALGNPGAIARESVTLAGNRWLSGWVAGSDPLAEREVEQAARVVGGRRAILVTLQERVPYREALEPLLRAAPPDWLWLVRLHRTMRESPQEIEAQLHAATGARVEAVAATRRPLYAWLRLCAWQLTGFSTCALEALPFGVPTLLWDESGARVYADLVSRQVMGLHRDVAASLRALSGASAEQADACRRVAREIFAEPAEPEALWAELEAHAGDARARA